MWCVCSYFQWGKILCWNAMCGVLKKYSDDKVILTLLILDSHIKIY